MVIRTPIRKDPRADSAKRLSIEFGIETNIYFGVEAHMRVAHCEDNEQSHKALANPKLVQVVYVRCGRVGKTSLGQAVTADSDGDGCEWIRAAAAAYINKNGGW